MLSSEGQTGCLVSHYNTTAVMLVYINPVELIHSAHKCPAEKYKAT